MGETAGAVKDEEPREPREVGLSDGMDEEARRRVGAGGRAGERGMERGECER